MKVRTTDFPPEGKEFVFAEEPSWGKRVSLSGPVSGRVRVDASGEYFLVRGEIQTEVELECARCLKHYHRFLSTDIEAVLVGSERFVGLSADTVELTPEDLNITLFEGDSFDLDPIIEDQILLALPAKPVCDENCAGICPECGADRNVEPCRCHARRAPSPFDALRNLKLK